MTADRARLAYVVGTFDTKAAELQYVSDLLLAKGVATVRLDVSTKPHQWEVDIAARAVAAHHRLGLGAVFGPTDRGQAITAMTEALRAYLATRDDVGGMIGLGGSGGTALITPAMRDLPLGAPKVMVSTLASGDTAPYVGVHDITMVFPVTDISGLNRLSRVILGNAAHALAGMMLNPIPATTDDKPALGMTMFGVTTPCVQQMTASLSQDYDCQVFHAIGSGGRAMEAMAKAGLLRAVVDITTTEVADHLLGGVCTAGAERLDAIVETGIPWIGSTGALDMVNFWAPDTVPEKYRGRHFHVHNANVTLMRTTAEEMCKVGTWIAEKLNRSPGPVCWLLPEGGVSALDAPGQAFHDPHANAAMIDAITRSFVPSASHRLVRVPHHINSPEFAATAIEQVRRVLNESARS